MTDYFNIEDILPYKYRPGTDLISKMILTDIQVINMLMKTLVPEAAEDLYVAVPTEFMNKNKCDVLYATFPPVFIEAQNQVDEKFLVRAVRYSTLIYERYNKHPILLIIYYSSKDQSH